MSGEVRGRQVEMFYVNVFSSLFPRLDSRSMFLMDTGPHMMIYIGTNASPQVVQRIFGGFSS